MIFECWSSRISLGDVNSSASSSIWPSFPNVVLHSIQADYGSLSGVGK